MRRLLPFAIALSLANTGVHAQTMQDVQETQQQLIELSQAIPTSQMFDDDIYLKLLPTGPASPLPKRITRIHELLHDETGRELLKEAAGNKLPLETWLDLADDTYCALRYKLNPQDFDLNTQSLKLLLVQITQDTTLTAEEKKLRSGEASKWLMEVEGCRAVGERLVKLLTPIEDSTQKD